MQLILSFRQPTITVSQNHQISTPANATGLTQARLVNATFDELRTVGYHLTVNTPNKTRYEGKTCST